jgi:hypothetical protein
MTETVDALKQLINKQFRNETETGAKLGLDDKYINAFKELLEAKNEELWIKNNCPQYYHSDNPEEMKLCGKREILGELISALEIQSSREQKENP